MRRALLALVILLAVMSLGAKGCSDDDRCRAARGLAEATCRLQSGTERCVEAQAEAERTCAPKETPPPEEEPTAPEDPHKPLCDAAAGLVSECWHNPPAGWRYNCADASTVKGKADCPKPPPGPAVCSTPIPRDGVCIERKDMPADARGRFANDLDAAIEAACSELGSPGCTERPGTWEQFIAVVAKHMAKSGRYCVTYDYLSGNSGQASEMSVRLASPAGAEDDLVENYQVEASSGLVRRNPGAFRSICKPACCEGQPIKGAPVVEAPPKKDDCRIVTRMDATLHNPQQRVYNVTPKAPDHARCVSIGKAEQQVCPLGPEGRNPEDNAARIACEKKRVGETGPVWSKVSGDVQILVQENPYLAKMVGGSGIVRVCTQPPPSGQEPQICSKDITVQ